MIPRAAKPGIAGTRDGALLVRLTAPPVEGAANAELIEVIAEAAGVPRRPFRSSPVIASRSKRVAIAGITR